MWLISAALVAALIAGAAVDSAALEQAAVALREARFDAALRILERAPAGDPRVLTLRGLALAGLGRNAASLDSYRRALAADAGYIPALQAKAELEYRTGHQAARATLQALLVRQPGNPVAHAMSATLAFERRDCKAAIPHFEQAGPEVSGNPQALSQFGYCLMAERRASDAVVVFRRASELAPEAGFYLGLLAAAYEANGQTAEALAALRTAAGRDPDEPSHYLDLGALCAEHGATALGVEVLTAGIRRLPEVAALRVALGVLYALDGNFQKAEAAFEAADRIDPSARLGSIGLSFSSTMLGDEQLDRSIAQLRRELAADPADAVKNYLLADGLLRKNALPGEPAFDEALKALLRAVKSKPDFAKARTAIGKLYLKMGSIPDAVRELERALKLDPSDQFATYQLGLALQRSGREAEAKAAMQRLRRLKQQEREADFQRRSVRLLRTR